MPFDFDQNSGQWQWKGDDSDWLGSPTVAAPSLLDDAMRRIRESNIEAQAKAADNYISNQQAGGLATATGTATGAPAAPAAPFALNYGGNTGSAGNAGYTVGSDVAAGQGPTDQGEGTRGFGGGYNPIDLALAPQSRLAAGLQTRTGQAITSFGGSELQRQLPAGTPGVVRTAVGIAPLAVAPELLAEGGLKSAALGAARNEVVGTGISEGAQATGVDPAIANVAALGAMYAAPKVLGPIAGAVRDYGNRAIAAGPGMTAAADATGLSNLSPASVRSAGMAAPTNPMGGFEESLNNPDYVRARAEAARSGTIADAQNTPVGAGTEPPYVLRPTTGPGPGADQGTMLPEPGLRSNFTPAETGKDGIFRTATFTANDTSLKVWRGVDGWNLDIQREGAGGPRGHSEGADLGALVQLRNVLADLKASNPGERFFAVPGDARRAAIYTRLGFDPSGPTALNPTGANELLELGNLRGTPAPADSGYPIVTRGSDLVRTYSDAKGYVDLGQMGRGVSLAADLALRAGQPVTMYIEGKPISITEVRNGVMYDAEGQRWGVGGLAMPKPGEDARIEFGNPAPATSPAAPSSPPTGEVAAGQPAPAGAGNAIYTPSSAPDAVARRLERVNEFIGQMEENRAGIQKLIDGVTGTDGESINQRGIYQREIDKINESLAGAYGRRQEMTPAPAPAGAGPTPSWSSPDGSIQGFEVGGHRVLFDNNGRGEVTVSTRRLDIQAGDVESLSSRTPGGSIAGLRDVGMLLDQYASAHPETRIVADPSDARRLAAYSRVFDPRADGAMVLNRDRLQQLLNRGSSPAPPPSGPTPAAMTNRGEAPLPPEGAVHLLPESADPNAQHFRVMADGGKSVPWQDVVAGTARADDAAVGQWGRDYKAWIDAETQRLTDAGITIPSRLDQDTYVPRAVSEVLNAKTGQWEEPRNVTDFGRERHSGKLSDGQSVRYANPEDTAVAYKQWVESRLPQEEVAAAGGNSANPEVPREIRNGKPVDAYIRNMNDMDLKAEASNRGMSFNEDRNGNLSPADRLAIRDALRNEWSGGGGSGNKPPDVPPSSPSAGATPEGQGFRDYMGERGRVYPLPRDMASDISNVGRGETFTDDSGRAVTNQGGTGGGTGRPTYGGPRDGGGPNGRPNIERDPNRAVSLALNEINGIFHIPTSIQTIGPHPLRIGAGYELSNPSLILKAEGAYLNGWKNPAKLKAALEEQRQAPGVRANGENGYLDFQPPPSNLPRPIATQITRVATGGENGILGRNTNAFTGRMDMLKMGGYEKQWELYQKLGETDPRFQGPREYQKAYQAIQHATGQAFSGGRTPEAASLTLYAQAGLARLATVGDLIFGTGIPGISPGSRAIALKALLADGALDATILGISALAGAAVMTPFNTNLTNAFGVNTKIGKAVSGATSIDPSTGYLPMIRFVANLANDYMNNDRDMAAQHIQDFARGQLGPIPGQIANVVIGKDYKQDPFTWKDLGTQKNLADMFSPLGAKGMFDALNTPGGNPYLAGWGLGGVSTTTKQPTQAFMDRLQNNPNLDAQALYGIQDKVAPYFNMLDQNQKQGMTASEQSRAQTQYLAQHPEIVAALRQGGYSAPVPTSIQPRTFGGGTTGVNPRGYTGGTTSIQPRDFQQTYRTPTPFQPRNKQPVPVGAQ